MPKGREYMKMSLWWAIPLGTAVFLAILNLVFFLTNKEAYRQEPDKIAVRPPGSRHLSRQLEDARPRAIQHLEFAWISQAAYEKAITDRGPTDSTCPDPVESLQEAGWQLWKDFPEPKIHKKFEESHLRLEVWTNPEKRALAVGCGGTVFKSGKDWKSNLRWFTFKHNDEYTDIVETFAPALAERLDKMKYKPEWAFLHNSTFYATGHSLGGGLAQQLAYAQRSVKDLPRITTVYAFDPSPVTGFYTVDENLREQNKQGLTIERVYERGEILAVLRSFTSFVYKPSTENPVTKQVRYSLFRRVNPITGHSMSQLACKISQAAFGTLPKK
jgi:hypothetical protein